MKWRRLTDLSDGQRAQLKPLARAMRVTGVEPTHVMFSPGCTGALRRARQAKQRAFKLARARINRPKG